MPKYTYTESEKDWAVDGEESQMVKPRLYLPISAEQLRSLTVGDNIKVELKAKVLGLESRENKDNSSAEVQLELISSETENDRDREAIDELIED